MNWLTNKPFSGKVTDDRWDMCEHVESGAAEAHWLYCEDDSFGPVDRTVVCEECHKKTQEEADEVEEVCYDCGELKPMKEITEWKWYDFYAPQGDEPYCICDECWDKDTHKERRKKDKENYEAEMKYLNEQEEYDDSVEHEYDDGEPMYECDVCHNEVTIAEINSDPVRKILICTDCSTANK